MSEKVHVCLPSAAGVVALGVAHQYGVEVQVGEESTQVDSLLGRFPDLNGTSAEEQKQVTLWREKENVSVGDLNKALNLRVYVADTFSPSIADWILFSKLRDTIKAQNANDRNQFCNVTRWFNNLQRFVAPELDQIQIKLVYTAPKKDEKKEEPKPTGRGRGDQKQQNQRRAPEQKATGIARLKLQVGKIEEIQVHPTVPSLYVEKINIGEDQPRTVVSKLAEKIPIDQMNQRLVVVATNLLPAELQGITSAGLVFCASVGEDVEVLTPPEGSKIGEQITIKGIVNDPGENINRKIFSRAIKGLETNDECVACYQKVPLETSAGVVRVGSLKGASIK